MWSSSPCGTALISSSAMSARLLQLLARLMRSRWRLWLEQLLVSLPRLLRLASPPKYTSVTATVSQRLSPNSYIHSCREQLSDMVVWGKRPSGPPSTVHCHPHHNSKFTYISQMATETMQLIQYTASLTTTKYSLHYTFHTIMLNINTIIKHMLGSFYVVLNCFYVLIMWHLYGQFCFYATTSRLHCCVQSTI